MNEKTFFNWIIGFSFVLCICTIFAAGYYTGNRKPKDSTRIDSDFASFVELSRDFIARERTELNQSRIDIERDRQRLDRQRSALESERIRLERERTALDGDRHSVEQLDSLIEQTIDILEGK